VGIVLCTTGFTPEQLKAIDEAGKVIPVLKSANMSMGINLISKLIKEAAVILADAGFDIEIVEKHHNKKVDAPSGTALALADAMNEVLNNEYEYKYDRSTERAMRPKKEIGISAVRGGTIVGEHEIIFAGIDEVIEIKHTAYSKAIFAKGAVQAAKFLPGNPAGMYSMSDVIN
jgi:4-hydroxy-tetrahydrodipicolinate reductase